MSEAAAVGSALLLAIGLGGVGLFLSKLDTDKKIKVVSNHSHDFTNLLHKNGYSERDVLALRRSHSHPEDHPTKGNFQFLEHNVSTASNRIESMSKELWTGGSRKFVPAYHVGRDRVFLPAQVMPGESPKYEVYTTENYYKDQDGYRGDWVTIVDLTKALQALNAKVEAYKSEGHHHPQMEEYMNHIHVKRDEDEDGSWTGRWDYSPYYFTQWQLPGNGPWAL